MDIDGTVERGFEPVADAFAANFSEHGDIGAAVCVYREGRAIVDLWGGLADRDQGRPWSSDTMAVVFSTTKGPTAVCAHLLVERGQLDLDAPIASYWPEFAANGKEHIPVRWALCHKAGLPAVDAELTLADVLAWDPVVAAVASQKPEWPPGSAHGYHARTYGWIVGEIVRRITGATLGRFFATEVAAPLGLDFWIGLPAEHEPRVATMYPPERQAGEALLDPGTLLSRAMSGPSGLFGLNQMWNRRDLHAAELPSSNGIGTAHALARHYAALVVEVDGVRLLRPETVAAAGRVHAEGPDRVLPGPTRYGLGFALPPMLGTGMGPRSYGFLGSGGSLGFADPDAGIGFGYVMNRLKGLAPGDGRSAGLVDALYGCL
jgi:CubicO group peptidase (beta-lactamase class C family)